MVQKGMLILDLECTCSDKDEFPRYDMEIIQIGAVVLDEQLKVVREFNIFMKPVLNPVLTDFCKKLTGISQDTVDNAETAIEALKQFDQFTFDTWRYHGGHWGSWGMFDRNQFIKEFNRNGIHGLIIDECTHHNLKNAWANDLGVRPMGLGKAIHLEGLKFQGSAHNGLDDAKNIARLEGIHNYIKQLRV